MTGATHGAGSRADRAAIGALFALGLLLATSGVARQDERVGSDPSRFWDAARSGDLAQVQRMVEAGIDIDVADRWSGTALFKAAAAGRLEVVRYLLEQGADPDVKESFWGQRVMDAALADGHFEVAAELLRAGADAREQAFMFAMMRSSGAEDPARNLALAEAAVESGPFYASALEQLAQRNPPEGYAALIERANSRPDPPPPELSAEDLEPYVGDYEGWADDRRVQARIDGEALVLQIDGRDPVPLVATGENEFASADGSLRVAYFGRAGSIEGIFLSGTAQGALRRSVAEPVTDVPERARRARAEWESRQPLRQTTTWPGFRGPNGDGIGDGKATPVRWDLASGENVLWTASLDGLGNSSPVIVGDRVFLTTAVADGVDQEVLTGDTGTAADVEESVEHSWRVLAFDRATGEELWQTEVGRGVPKTRRHLKASQANSTPVTDGRSVVAVFPTAGMAALDARTGKIRWHHDLGPLNASNFFDPDDQWGFSSSPILYDGKVILQVDIFGGGYLAAWDLETGEQVWKTERDTATSWSTPTLLEGRDGKPDELIVNASSIRGYDPTTGEQLWSLGPNSELVIARPVVSDGVAYVSAGYPPVKPVYAIRAGLRGDLEVKPGEEHGALLWSHRIGGAYMPSPLLYRGLYYVVHHNGRIVAYDAKTGDAYYKKRFSRSGMFTGSPVVNNGRIYIPTEGGLLYVVAAGPEYEELAIHDFDEPLMATPAIADGVLYVRTPKRLIAIGEQIKPEDVGPR